MKEIKSLIQNIKIALIEDDNSLVNTNNVSALNYSSKVSPIDSILRDTRLYTYTAILNNNLDKLFEKIVYFFTSTNINNFTLIQLKNEDEKIYCMFNNTDTYEVNITIQPELLNKLTQNNIPNIFKDSDLDQTLRLKFKFPDKYNNEYNNSIQLIETEYPVGTDNSKTYYPNNKFSGYIVPNYSAIVNDTNYQELGYVIETGMKEIEPLDLYEPENNIINSYNNLQDAIYSCTEDNLCSYVTTDFQTKIYYSSDIYFSGHGNEEKHHQEILDLEENMILINATVRKTQNYAVHHYNRFWYIKDQNNKILFRVRMVWGHGMEYHTHPPDFVSFPYTLKKGIYKIQLLIQSGTTTLGTWDDGYLKLTLQPEVTKYNTYHNNLSGMWRKKYGGFNIHYDGIGDRIWNGYGIYYPSRKLELKIKKKTILNDIEFSTMESDFNGIDAHWEIIDNIDNIILTGKSSNSQMGQQDNRFPYPNKGIILKPELEPGNYSVVLWTGFVVSSSWRDSYITLEFVENIDCLKKIDATNSNHFIKSITFEKNNLVTKKMIEIVDIDIEQAVTIGYDLQELIITDNSKNLKDNLESDNGFSLIDIRTYSRNNNNIFSPYKIKKIDKYNSLTIKDFTGRETPEIGTPLYKIEELTNKNQPDSGIYSLAELMDGFTLNEIKQNGIFTPKEILEAKPSLTTDELKNLGYTISELYYKPNKDKITFEQIKFVIHETRTTPGSWNDKHRQISEIKFFDDSLGDNSLKIGNTLIDLTNVSVENPGGRYSTYYSPNKVIDGETNNSYWRDSNGGDLIFTFNNPIHVSSYDFATGDSTSYYPVRFELLGKNMSDTNWTSIHKTYKSDKFDKLVGGSYSLRYTFQGPFRTNIATNPNGIYSLAELMKNNVFTLNEIKTSDLFTPKEILDASDPKLTINQFKELGYTIAELTNKNQPDSGIYSLAELLNGFTLSEIRIVGLFTPKEILEAKPSLTIDEFKNAEYTIAELTNKNQPNIGIYSLAELMDGFTLSEIKTSGLFTPKEIRDTKPNLTIEQFKDAGYTFTELYYKPNEDKITFEQIKFVIHETRTTPGSWNYKYRQISEIQFFDDSLGDNSLKIGNTLIDLTNVSVENPGGNSGTTTYSPNKVIDGNNGTIWQDQNGGDLIFTFNTPIHVSSYDFANTMASWYYPVRFELLGKNMSDTNWTSIHKNYKSDKFEQLVSGSNSFQGPFRTNIATNPSGIIYSLAELMEIDDEFKFKWFSLKEIRNSYLFTPNEIFKTSNKKITINQFKDAGYYISELSNKINPDSGIYSLAELLNGFTLSEIRIVGLFTPKEILEAKPSLTINQFKDAGYTIVELSKKNNPDSGIYSLAELMDFDGVTLKGFSLQEIRNSALFTPKEILEEIPSLTINQFKDAGYTIVELTNKNNPNSGIFSLVELLNVFTLNEIKTSDLFTPKEILDALDPKLTINQFKELGYTIAELTNKNQPNIGIYSLAELMDGFTLSEIRISGIFNPKEIETINPSITIDELKNLGYTISELYYKPNKDKIMFEQIKFVIHENRYNNQYRQISEIQFFDDSLGDNSWNNGTTLIDLANVSVENPGGNYSTYYSPNKVIDGYIRPYHRYWQDSNGGDLIFTFNNPIHVSSYDFATGDSTSYYPVRFELLGKNMSDTNWTSIHKTYKSDKFDKLVGGSYSLRYTFQGPFRTNIATNPNGIYSLAELMKNNVFTLNEIKTSDLFTPKEILDASDPKLTINQFKELGYTIAELTNKNQPDSGIYSLAELLNGFTLSEIRFVGLFTPKEILETKPSLTIDEFKNLGYTISELYYKPNKDKIAFEQIKFVIHENRNNNQYRQISEIKFFDDSLGDNSWKNGTTLIDLANVSVENPGGNYYTFQSPNKVIDGETNNSYWRDSNGGDLIFTFNNPIHVSSYDFATGGSTSYYPVKFELLGKNMSDTNWTSIHKTYKSDKFDKLVGGSYSLRYTFQGPFRTNIATNSNGIIYSLTELLNVFTITEITNSGMFTPEEIQAATSN